MQGDRLWRKYIATSQGQLRPFRLRLSLRFGHEGDSRRVTALFWGNGDRHLRLDVMAGVGAIIAKIMQDGEHFLIYSPGEDRAYFHQGPNSPLFRLGVPFPFGLAQLAALLDGHYTESFGERSSMVHALQDGLWTYGLADGPGGRLTLDTRGLPVLWQEKGPNSQGWRMEIHYDDAEPPLPRRLDLQHSNGDSGVLLIKGREKDISPFSPDRLRLSLPDTAPLLPLSRFRSR